MNSELGKLKESVLSLTSELTKDNIRNKLLHIEYLLSDYYFVNDLQEIEKVTPAQILSNSLKAPYLENTGQRVYFEWFAVLALYWLKKIDEIPLYKEQFLEYCLHARNLAQTYLEKANHLENKTKRQNRKKMAAVSEKKYTPNSILKARVFREYAIAYEKLQQEGQRITNGAIIKLISPTIERHNRHPKTGKKIIGRNSKDGVFDSTLTKWFGQGVKAKILKSPRDQ